MFARSPDCSVVEPRRQYRIRAIRGIPLRRELLPHAETVTAAARAWTADVARGTPSVVAAGYFGSYARGNWGVGSDLDLVVIVEASAEPFERRAVPFDTLRLPVPVDLLVYTRAEWTRLASRLRDVVWLVGTAP